MSHRKAGDASPREAHSLDLDPFIKMFSRDKIGKTRMDMTAGEMRETRGHKRRSVLSEKLHYGEQILVNTPCVFPKARVLNRGDRCKYAQGEEKENKLVSLTEYSIARILK